ncbi:MAG TPA: DUF1080 domain-containing protein [Porphyromonadaceae bacterium]|jgi:hypothetical protein|nr:DUF1080 domain-containing protein [Porphyromonadaceae bacterium]HBL33475.1 DUF1080 domain-containing protein [Porphyromonadaceae bacterium]HBX20402.1 DUF1080 domain-containing protein [Porphyromonadaceae bacterium]
MSFKKILKIKSIRPTAFMLLFVVYLFTFRPGNASNKPVEPSNRTDTVRLLGGNDLKNWYTFIKDRGIDNDPNKVFSITTEGFLHITGEEWGCITTKEEFKDYKIILDYKWGNATYSPRKDKARDSGLLLHSTGKNGAYSGTWMYAFECNIIEGGTGDFIVVGDGTDNFSLTGRVAPEKQNNSYLHHPYGTLKTIHKGRINWVFRDPEWRDEKNFRGKYDVENNAGDWNRLECWVKGDEIKVFLNGKTVNHALRVAPNKGRIQIQSEGAEIFFRKIDLIPIYNNEYL